MTPFMFGPAARRLFGAFHPGDAAHPPRLGVVLCSPFGEEASRTHRFFYVLADRLSRAGIDALRFDYYGTGDSAGEDGEGDLDGWAADLRAAHEELRRRSRASRIAFLGARLGATVAIRAARDAAPGTVSRLLAWEPIVDGAGYLDALRTRRIGALESAYSVPNTSWRRQAAGDPMVFIDETVSFAVSSTLRRQLAELTPDTLALPGSVDTVVIADPTDALVQRWAHAQRDRGAPVRPIGLDSTLGWLSDERAHQAPVPRQVLQRILSIVES